MGKDIKNGTCPACNQKSWRRIRRGKRLFFVCRVCGHIEEGIQ